MPVLLIQPGTRRPTVVSLEATHVDIDATLRPVGDSTGAPLPPDCAVELGYYSKSRIGNAFAGTWVPLIGARAAHENRKIPFIRAGAHGEARGRFRWCRAFYPGIEELPPTGALLGLRFFDNQDPAAARHFNTATHPSWWFRSPKGPIPAHMELTLDDDATWESGPGGAFTTPLSAGPIVLRLLESGRALFRRHAAPPTPAVRAPA